MNIYRTGKERKDMIWTKKKIENNLLLHLNIMKEEE